MRHLPEEQRKRVIGNGDEKDIYCWVSGLPDSILGPIPDGAERCESFYCFERFGFMKNLPGDRYRKKGCYLRGFAYCDWKAGWLLMKIGRPFMYSGCNKMVETMSQFINN